MVTEGPILITGTFRSGTTLIAQMLKNHPDIELVYDSVNFMRFSYEKFDPLADFSNVESLVKEIHERILERWNMDFDSTKVLISLKGQENTYGSIYDALMKELLLVISKAKIWGEKTTLVWTKIPAFFEMFPNGRVIHIIRDPRAILSSWKKMTNAPGNDYLDAILNCYDSMKKMKQYNIEFKDKRYVALKYEDLVIDSKQQMVNISDKLELPFSDDMLNPEKFSDKEGKKWAGNSMFDNKVKGISANLIDVWKTKLENWEIFLTEQIIGEYMDYFGYKKISNAKPSDLMQNIISKIQSSKLVTEGLLYHLLTGEGYERFPSDPLDPKNWAEKSR